MKEPEPETHWMLCAELTPELKLASDMAICYVKFFQRKKSRSKLQESI